MSFICKGEEAYEVASLLKDYLVPKRRDEADNGIDLSLDFAHKTLYELSESDSEKIFNECCARRHEWAIGKTSSFFRNVLVPQMISHSLENFTNFVNVRNTNWLTKGDILLLRTIQYKQEEFSAMYESLIDLVPRKTEYDWTIVDTTGSDDNEEQDDFDGVDVSETIFYPVTEESFSNDPIMPENFLARSSPRQSRESTPIIKKVHHSSSRPSPHLSDPSKEDRVSERAGVDVDSVFTADFDDYPDLNDISEPVSKKASGSSATKRRFERSCSRELKTDFLHSNHESVADIMKRTSPIRPRRSVRRKQQSESFVLSTSGISECITLDDVPPRSKSNITPKKTKRDIKIPTLNDKVSSMLDFNENLLPSPQNGTSLSDMLIRAQIDKEIALATYYKVLTQKELLQINIMKK